MFVILEVVRLFKLTRLLLERDYLFASWSMHSIWTGLYTLSISLMSALRTLLRSIDWEMGHLRLLLKLRQNLLPTYAKSPAVTTKSALKAQVNGDRNFIDGNFSFVFC